MFKQALIFAGGKGTRFLEQTKFLPKPMIRAKQEPLLIHIINHYIKFGVDDFYILTGYKHEVIDEYFASHPNFKKNSNFYISEQNVKITLLNTGEETLTGGRLLKAMDEYDFENFYLTYGDGISDVNIKSLTDYHIKEARIGTMTAVSPPPRFGNIEIEDGMVTRMSEKKEKEPSWINGGFFVFNNSIKNYLTKDEPFEQTPLINLAQQNQLSAYKHTGYWQCVDTIRELEILESDIDSEKIIV